VGQGNDSQIDPVRLRLGISLTWEEESCDCILLSVLSVSPITPFVYK